MRRFELFRFFSRINFENQSQCSFFIPKPPHLAFWLKSKKRANWSKSIKTAVFHLQFYIAFFSTTAVPGIPNNKN